MRLTRTKTTQKLTSEIDRNFAQKVRKVWTTEPDPKQIREGERHLYYADDGVYFITQYDGKLWYLSGYSSPPNNADDLVQRYAFLTG